MGTYRQALMMLKKTAAAAAILNDTRGKESDLPFSEAEENPAGVAASSAINNNPKFRSPVSKEEVVAANQQRAARRAPVAPAPRGSVFDSMLDRYFPRTPSIQNTVGTGVTEIKNNTYLNFPITRESLASYKSKSPAFNLASGINRFPKQKDPFMSAAYDINNNKLLHSPIEVARRAGLGTDVNTAVASAGIDY